MRKRGNTLSGIKRSKVRITLNLLRRYEMASHNGLKNSGENKKWKVADYFSRESRFWKIIYSESQDEIDKFYSAEIINRKEAVLRFISEHAGNNVLSVLDAGCGSGVFVDELIKQGHVVVGMDLSTEMIRETNRIRLGYPEARALCVQGDTEQLPFKSDSFDVVLSVGVFPWINDEKRSLDEMRRVCKRGGIIVFSVPNRLRTSALLDPYCWIQQAKIKLRTVLRGDDASRVKAGSDTCEILTEMKRYYLITLEQQFERFNLNRIGEVGIGFGPVSFWQRTFLPDDVSIHISNGIQKLLRLKVCHFLNHFANHFVICLEKR